MRQRHSICSVIITATTLVLSPGCLEPDPHLSDEAASACTGSEERDILIRLGDTPNPAQIWTGSDELQPMLDIEIANCSDRHITASAFPLEFRGVGQPFMHDGAPLIVRLAAGAAEAVPTADVNMKAQTIENFDAFAFTLGTHDHPLISFNPRTPHTTNVLRFQGVGSDKTGVCSLSVGSSTQFPWHNVFRYEDNSLVPDERISGGSIVTRVVVSHPPP